MKKVLVLAGVIALGALATYFVLTPTKSVTASAAAGLYIPDTATTVPRMEPLRTMYGFDVDQKRVIEGRIRPNQFLSELLGEYGVSYETVNLLVNRSHGVFDVRKIASNREYAFICAQDSTGPAERFIYEPSPYEFVVFNLTDSVYVERVARRVDTVEMVATGIIRSSLYETLTDANNLPQLANEMADVFAWQIDFFHLAKDDRFKVIYEQYQIEGEPVGVGSIRGAVFEHNSNPYYAIHYDQGEGDVYFDEEGESLRKQFLRAPLDYTRISSRFTYRRFHPVQRRYKAHLGTDYAAPTGTPIRAVGDGVVVEAQYSRYNGNYVKIRHNSVYTTQYLHMSKIAGGMRPGYRVRQGEVIGYVGATGLATGPHLCYRFWKNGQQVDALKEELPPSEPIKEDHAARYFEVKNQMLQRLEKIPYTEAAEVVAEAEEEENKEMASLHQAQNANPEDRTKPRPTDIPKP